MELANQAGDEIREARDALEKAVKEFALGYPSFQNDRQKLIVALGEIISSNSRLLETVNMWLIRLHQHYDFSKNQIQREDYLNTVSNVLRSTAQKYSTVISKISAKHDIKVGLPDISTYKLMQSFICSFGGENTLHDLVMAFEQAGIPTEGFKEKFPVIGPPEPKPNDPPGKSNNMINYLSVINRATKAVPFMNYALALAGIAALLALVKSYGLSWEVGVFGTIVVVVFMTVIFLLARASINDQSSFRYIAHVLVVAIALVFIVTMGLFVSCAFFDKPKSLNELIHHSSEPLPKSDSVVHKDTNTNFMTIQGHVYQHDYSPAVGMHIILSVMGTNTQTTSANGGFVFNVKREDITDTILINVWSSSLGFKHQKFGKASLIGLCDIVLDPPNRKSLPAKKQPYSQQRNICHNLIIPLGKYIDQSAKLYAEYVRGYSYGKATEIYTLDKRMNQLIRENTPLIPDSLSQDIGLLIQHLSAWTQAYEDKKKGVPRDTSGEFRINYEGVKFPAQSASRILGLPCPSK